MIFPRIQVDNKRIKRNRVFKGIAERGKSTMGWFYGFKLHIDINDKGELVGASISRGNVDNRDMGVLDGVLENVSRKLFADKGYISKKLLEYLYEKGTTLITSIKKNMKNMCDVENSRHRSPVNFMVNMIAGLIRYTYFEKKPSINFSQKDREILRLAVVDIENKALVVL